MGTLGKQTYRCVAYCPRCGNRAPQTLVHTQKITTTIPGPDSEEVEVEAFCYVGSCDTCNGILVYEDPFSDGDEPGFATYFLIWPAKKTLSHVVPEQIRKIYEEAALIQKASPNAFAVQVRRGLEAICNDRGIDDKNLSSALRKLAEKGEIPKVLTEVTDVLRLLGNVGAHFTGQSVHPSQTPALDDFFKAVVEYIYVAPSKLQEFKQQLEGFRKLGSEKQ